MRLPEITDRFGESGITDLALSKDSHIALISDDTQMTIIYGRRNDMGIPAL